MGSPLRSMAPGAVGVCRVSRRKNAGEGYGFNFHGAFTDKEDAVKKEKKTPGSFIKGRLTQHGYRWIVMSPRKNPIRRKKKLARELWVGERQFRTWPAAFKAARKLADKSGDKVQVLVREDGHELRHWVEPTLYRAANPGRPFIGPGGKVFTSGRRGTIHYRGFKIKRSGKLFRVFYPDGREFTQKYPSEEAAYRVIDQYAPGGEYHRENPGELIVLGANPHGSRDITVPAGSTITIRTNPVQSNPLCGAAVGAGMHCSRKPGHKGPHLPQGATLRPRSRVPSSWVGRRSNPSAAAIREEFTGTRSERFFVQDAPGLTAGDYAQLGELLALHVKPVSGGQRQTIEFPQGERPLLLCDETRRQLYFLDGDQDVSAALPAFGIHHATGTEEILLGSLRRIDYKQRKEHVEQPDLDEWRHDLGEETHVFPDLYFDPVHRRLVLRGGEYEVRREGIVN